MEPLQIGIIGLIVLFALLALGMPIGISMGLVGIVGFAILTTFGAAMSKFAHTAFAMTNYYPIAVIPLFLLMGEFASAGGITQDAFRVSHKWLGRLPGGMAMATIAGCAAFAAVCGSSLATAVAIGNIALPEMNKYNYHPKLSLGSIAAGGTLGILIPPSAGFILYGIFTEQSIGKLFIAGIFPGILLSALFILVIYIVTKRNPLLGPVGPEISWHEKLFALKDIWGVLILFALVIGGIYSGVFTPTEAAGAGAFLAFVIALARRRLTWTNLVGSFMSTLVTSGMIFVIIIGATLLGYFLAASNLTIMLGEFVTGLPVPPLLVLIAILLLFLVLGCVMEAFSMLVLIVPIIFPAVVALGIDPIWFGVLTVIMMEMGLITPPIGMNVFGLVAIARDVPMGTVFMGIWPFAGAMAICVAIVVAFPQIALFLPGTM